MSKNSVQPESQGWDLWPMRKWRQFLLDYLQACVGVAPWPVSTFELLRLQGAGSFVCQVQLCMLILKYFHISHQFCSSLGTARLVSSFLSYWWRKFSSGMGIAGMGLHRWAEGGFEPRSPTLQGDSLPAEPPRKSTILERPLANPQSGRERPVKP